MTDSKQRYLTHITTDKPIYKKNDVIYIRAVLVGAISQKPVSKKISDLYLDAVCKILGPKGDCVKELSLIQFEKSIHVTQFTIPEDAAGGDYTIKIEYKGHGLPSAERKVEIRGFQNPRLNSQLEFVKKGYGAGERAMATLSVKRAEGGIPEGAIIKFTARIDGEETNAGQTKLDAKGNCVIEFDLPKLISVGDGTLNCVIQDGGVVETASKTIPILLQTIHCEVYPEGGDLVEGLECGLYIEAATPFGEPADLSADIVDTFGNVVGTIATQHEGRGKGSFVPKEGLMYNIAVRKPSGITNLIPIPKAKKDGVSLLSTSDVYQAQEALKFTLSSTKKSVYLVSIAKREKTLSSIKVSVGQNEKKDVVFTLPDSTESDGVLRVTVYEIDTETPCAERLIFRKPLDSISISVQSDYKSFCPGDHAKLKIKATDSKGKPVSTYLTVTVTDESVLETKEKRKQPPRLPAMVFLEQEVSKLEDAKIYLSNDPKADVAVDLLLGTQGWRKFAFTNIHEFVSKNKEVGERIACIHAGQDKPIDIPSPQKFMMMRGGGPMRNEMKQQVQFNAPPPMMMQKPEMPMPKGAPPKIKGPEMIKVEEKKIAPQLVEMKPDLKKDLKPSPMRGLVAPMKKKQMEKEEAIPRARRRVNDLNLGDFDGKQAITVIQYVRVYSHVKRPDRRAGDRVDFQETLYWNACLKTDKEGILEVQFDMSDSVSSFHVLVDAFSKKGVFGSGDKLIESKEPFYLEPKLPLEVTSGDIINLPVVVVNSSMETLNVTIKGDLPKCITGTTDAKIEIKTDERKRLIFDLKVGSGNSSVPIILSGGAGPFSDSVTRTIKVVPSGFPMSITQGGMMKEKVVNTFKFKIPESVDSSSITTSLLFMPTPAASLTSAMEALLREPSGCFEQTSTTTYPNIIAHQYLTTHHGVDPALIQRSYGLIEKGYKRLITFECKEGGYEWFGSGPGHEALTAYGTLEFMDMAKVYPVDPEMLARTKKWLYSRRDGNGGFLRNQKALDAFGGAPTNTTNAYIVWSLTEGGEVGLDKEVDFMSKDWQSQKDTYFLGLVAGCLYNTKRPKEAEEIATKLIEFQQEDGSVNNAVTSITKSGADSLKIETTAISILVWLSNDEKYAKHTEKAMIWLLSRCNSGKFGSTQGTILALKAIVKYDKARARPSVDGFATVKVDGKQFRLEIPKTATGTITCPSFASSLGSGEYTCEISLSAGISLPFAFAVEYYALKPDSAQECVVNLHTKLNADKYEEGSGGEMKILVQNLSKEKLGMTLAIVGLPGGMEPRHEQLQELVKMEKVSAYEIRGREVIFYFRGMTESQEIDFKMDIIARIPGRFTAPASRVYLYYTDEYKKWVDGCKCEIVAK